MNTITIPKTLTQKGALVVITRVEYTELLAYKKVREFTPTLAQKEALVSAERNFRRGKTLSYDGLIRKLGFTNR